MWSPRNFLVGHIILIPNSFDNGLGYVDLVKNTEDSSLLVKNVSNIKIGSMYAQCLMPLPNEENPVILDNNADYFFTPALSGCQILIYKNSKGEICIEHNNYIGNTKYYFLHYIGVALYNPILCCIHATNHSPFNYGEGYNINTSQCCVVGVRRGSTWTFYYKNNNIVGEYMIQI